MAHVPATCSPPNAPTRINRPRTAIQPGRCTPPLDIQPSDGRYSRRMDDGSRTQARCWGYGCHPKQVAYGCARKPGGRVMLERAARPLRGFGNGTANVVKAIYGGLGFPGRLLQDLLNGSWLGHSLHAVLVDVVIGAATAALLLDILGLFFGVEGLETATMWVSGLAWISGVGSIMTGLTDYKDT